SHLPRHKAAVPQVSRAGAAGMCLKQSLCPQVATLLIRRPGLLVHLLQALFPTPPQSRSRQESSIQIPPTTLRLTRTLFDLADAAASKMQMKCSLCVLAATLSTRARARTRLDYGRNTGTALRLNRSRSTTAKK